MERQRARDGNNLKQWRTAVYQRDHYTCQRCGHKGTKLHAHHNKSYADFPNLRFDVDNGITVCIPCHEKIHNRKLV